MAHRKLVLYKSVIYASLIFMFGITLISCSGSENSSENLESQPSPSFIVTPTFRFGNPIENETQALIAANSGLRSDFEYSEPLNTIFARKMSFSDSSEFTGSSAEPAPKTVWLIVYFNDKWQSISHNPRITPDPPFRGCVFVIINAEDGLLVGNGGPLMKGKVEKCKSTAG